ncbi:hypothetical protein BVRB_006780 [Beta vulgaris subsp. vulgaris]|uniref:Uncharacterized protein n=1 Tax=Beta vulgaris subsp. vulgaris TaxID=3555 RepID=A0A0J8DXL0_BETVV|nr:hypothetical protein BVRB_006780 [Beta vulgaris subsp. vulgaris]
MRDGCGGRRVSGEEQQQSGELWCAFPISGDFQSLALSDEFFNSFLTSHGLALFASSQSTPSLSAPSLSLSTLPISGDER